MEKFLCQPCASARQFRRSAHSDTRPFLRTENPPAGRAKDKSAHRQIQAPRLPFNFILPTISGRLQEAINHASRPTRNVPASRMTAPPVPVLKSNPMAPKKKDF